MDVKELIAWYCIYGILYCFYAVSVVLAHREVQIRRFKQIERDADNLNNLYLRLVSKCKESPRENISPSEISKELIRLKRTLLLTGKELGVKE